METILHFELLNISDSVRHFSWAVISTSFIRIKNITHYIWNFATNFGNMQQFIPLFYQNKLNFDDALNLNILEAEQIF